MTVRDRVAAFRAGLKNPTFNFHYLNNNNLLINFSWPILSLSFDRRAASRLGRILILFSENPKPELIQTLHDELYLEQ